MATVPYAFRITDDSGALVPGAALTIGGTLLTAGTAHSVNLVNLASGAALDAVSIQYFDFGTGDYVLLYDAEANGEAYIALSAAKTGSTLTNGNATVPIIATRDSSRVLTALPIPAPNALGGLPTGDAAGRVLLQPAQPGVTLPTVTSLTSAPPDSAGVTTLLTEVVLLLGLVGNNAGIRNQTYDGDNNLLSADLCAYDTPAHALTNDGATGLLHKWNLALTYSGTNQATQTIALVE